MGTLYVNTTVQTSVANATAYTLGADDNLYLGSSGRLLALGDGAGAGLLISGVFLTAVLDGDVFAHAAAVRLAGDEANLIVNGGVASARGGGIRIEGGEAEVFVSATGQVTGNYGIYTDTDGDFAEIVNHGEITGRSYGALLDDAADLINLGRITGAVAAIIVEGDGIDISNAGVLAGGSFAVELQGQADITNSGLMQGAIGAPLGMDADWLFRNSGELIGDLGGGSGVETVRNTGLIEGEVSLLGGNDVYNGQRGGLDGDLLGGTGDDLLRAGADDDRIFGDLGLDTLRGGAGDDLVEGGDGNDQLLGGDGADTLDGGRNADRLTGGMGDDVLTGDRNGDVFAFRGEIGHDLITDFDASGEDRIEVAKGIFRTFNQLQGNMAQSGSDVVITVSATESITLQNVLLADLTGADFAFVA